LSNVLRKCEFKKARLEAMFPKRQTQRKSHVCHTTHAQSHAHHAHYAPYTKNVHTTHAHYARSHHIFLYAKVYTCTNWGLKGHLTKFSYDKLNASNSHVWVRKTNTLGPNKIRISKSAFLLIDIGTHQGSKT